MSQRGRGGRENRRVKVWVRTSSEAARCKAARTKKAIEKRGRGRPRLPPEQRKKKKSGAQNREDKAAGVLTRAARASIAKEKRKRHAAWNASDKKKSLEKTVRGRDLASERKKKQRKLGREKPRS